ncbi:MAG: hypothetical protein MUF83_16875 [Acidimicrobiales bacterium]|nr:hypothetical protein [Acidimicrobiales bacterium]
MSFVGFALAVGGVFSGARVPWPPFLVGGVVAGLAVGWGAAALMVRRARRQLTEAPTRLVWWHPVAARSRRRLRLPVWVVVSVPSSLFLAAVGYATGPFGVAVGALMASAALVVAVVWSRKVGRLEAESGWRLFRLDTRVGFVRQVQVVRTWWRGRLGYDLENGLVISPPAPLSIGVDDLPDPIRHVMLHRSSLYRQAADLGVAGYRGSDPCWAYNTACSLARAGDEADAFVWLQKAVDDGWADVRMLRRDPDFARLRTRPAFGGIIAAARDNSRRR